MEADKIPPHLSAEEHSLRVMEEQLLKDGHQWLKRAAALYTQTPKIKIWVPVLCSVVLTAYYLSMLHAGSAASNHLAHTPVQLVPSVVPEAVAVADNTPFKKSQSIEPGSDGSLAAGTTDADASDSELLRQAQQAHAGRQFSDEASFLEKLIDRSKSTQPVCPAIGKAYEQAGEIDAALKAFARCLAHDPNNVDTLVAFGHALQAKPDFDRASAMYRRGLRNDPVNVDAANGLALVELRQNHLQRAEQAARLILSKAPDNTDALLITGIVAWRRSKLPEAEKIFLRGIQLDDRRADFHGFLGRVEEAERRQPEALQQYERALSLDPTDNEVAERRDRLRDVR